MALFGRRKPKITDEDLLDDTATSPRPEPADGVPGVDRPWVRAEDGPYDVTEWADLDGRIDLGALRLPAVQGMQLRLDLEGKTQKVTGATAVFGASQVQLQAFAAPRTLGLWTELRPDIARGLVDAGGAAEIVDGMLGKEIKARMPGRAPDGRVAFQPARFLGVDGSRWFLRVVINGPAATDDTQLQPILEFVRKIVVSRGDDPRPPREVLELTPPDSVLEAAKAQVEARRAQQAAAAAKQTQVLRGSDATAVSGVGTAGRETPQAGGNPQDPPTEAPKPPHNPEFT